MKQGSDSRDKIVALLLCILGIAISVPIRAQKKARSAPLRSVSYNVPSGYTQVGNTMLYYYQSSASIDVQGCYNKQYYGSTYSNNGYRVAMQVNNGTPSQVDCLNGSTISGVSFSASIEPQGELARVCYSVTNTNQKDVIVSLGTHADVMIGNNDRAPISRRIDTTGNTYGVTMKDGNGAQLCVLFGSGLAGVTSVSDYWFGYYYLNHEPYYMVGNYSSGEDYMQENGSYDSGMGWCWKNKTIPASSTVVFSYLIGIGEVNLEPNSSFEVTPDDPEGWNDLSRPHKLALEGTYESPAGLDGMIEYAVEDSEEWHQLTEMIPSGSTFCDSLVVTFDATREKHVIRFRTRDNVGNTTLLPSIEYLDVSFHEYSGIVDKIYTGDSIFQDVACVDVEGMKVSTGKYSGNVNAGNATFYIEGVFPYTIGRKACSFRINPAQLTGSIDLFSDSFVYNGEEHLPGWTFTNESYEALEENRDYDVSYIDNIYPGTGKVCIAGKGNYTSLLEKTFFIDKAQLSDELYSITLPAEDISFDENEHKASATARTGVGEVKFTYTLHDDAEILQNAPVDEGHYDIYCEIADGDLYYGKANEYVGSFAIYRFDETEWQALGILYAELQQMNAPLSWNIAGGAKSVSTFEGLSIEEGHVVGVSLANKGVTGLFPSSLMSFTNLKEIDLSNNDLSGDVAVAIATVKMQDSLAFNSLKVLDISNNRYSGNIGILASGMPNLTTLDASNNKFEDLFPALPSSITNLDISNQKMERVVELNMSDLLLENMVTKVPTILLYDQVNRTYKNSINLLCTKADLATFNKYDTEEWAMQLRIEENHISIPYVSVQNAYYGESGDVLNVLNMTGNNTTDSCSFRIALSFNQGDANFVNGVDATDLQATILYAFGGYRNYPFNFTAADTYKDIFINVQDVICTVNILLSYDNESSPEAMSKHATIVRKAASSLTDDAYMYIRDGKVYLHSRVPVASLSIKADGNVKWDFGRIGLIQSTANGNIVAYSLNGTTIPSNVDVVLGECTNATLYSASLSDADAQPISVSFLDDNTTNITNTSGTTNEHMNIYDVSGYKKNSLGNGINIIRGNGTTKKIYKK